MSNELIVAVVGGLIGGILGVIGTLLSSYWGPRKFEEWKDRRKEQREFGPRKAMLRKLLEDPACQDGRDLETLCLYTGTSPEECRRLLIEIGARGTRLDQGEGWVLVSRKPFP